MKTMEMIFLVGKLLRSHKLSMDQPALLFLGVAGRKNEDFNDAEYTICT